MFLRNVTGFSIIPLRKCFTRATCCAWFSGVRFLWITPMPPSLAIAIAIWLSVTVSMAALMKGAFIAMLREKRVAVEASAGRKSAYRVSKVTSLNVNPSYLKEFINSAMYWLTI